MDWSGSKNLEKQILRSRYPDFWIRIRPQGSEKNFTCQNHIWTTTIVIVTSFAIDKMFEIYTFYENRTEICIFFENRTEIYTFYENKFEIYICILFENRTEISNILSMVDGLIIKLTLVECFLVCPDPRGRDHERKPWDFSVFIRFRIQCINLQILLSRRCLDFLPSSLQTYFLILACLLLKEFVIGQTAQKPN